MTQITKIKSPYKVEMLRIEKEENVDNILKKYSLTRDRILNDSKSFKSGDILLISTDQRKIHIVMPGQTIEDISKLYNIPKEEILSKNNTTTIFVGQILLI